MSPGASAGYHVVGRGLDTGIPAGLDAMASQRWHGLSDPPVRG